MLELNVYEAWLVQGMLLSKQIKDVIAAEIKKGMETIEQSSETQEGNKDTCRDILGKVFNVPEYSGRVRGKGFGVTPKSFFPQEKRQKPSNEEVLEKLRILSEQVALLVNTNKDKQLPVQLQPEIQMESETGSCNVGLKSIPEGVTTCVLYLSSPTQRKVGKGILHNTSGEVLHNIPIPAGHVKVSPTVAFEPTAPLPIPDNDGDMKFLSDAIGSYVAWPTHLVALEKKIPKDKSVTSPEKYGSLSTDTRNMAQWPLEKEERDEVWKIATGSERSMETCAPSALRNVRSKTTIRAPQT
ncbi:uncharacterized protein [Cicer arietinum]|uniref:uncharacterized protein n=1 Tax=Cicer arietinum TaxID=3827 RepID=UPI003CC66F04